MPRSRPKRTSETTSGSVRSFDRDSVQLDYRIAGFDGGVDAGEDAGELVAARDLGETLAIQGIEVNVEAAQAGIEQGLRPASKEDGIRGQGEVADAFDARPVFR